MLLPRLTLYSRSYCHLCEDMLSGLQALRQEIAFDLAVHDIDTDPALQARYDEWVPVLVAGEDGAARELCHYFLDLAALRDYLDAATRR